MMALTNPSMSKPKLMVLLVVITAIFCMFYEIYLQDNSFTLSIKMDNTNVDNHRGSHSRHGTKVGPQRKKVMIAFHYWEQLTMATKNLLELTSLAAYGERQVVVPFVKDSQFSGAPNSRFTETLELYYNVTALNRTLLSRGHATFISWKEFQDVCRGRLDVLVNLDYTPLNKTTKYSLAKPIIPCKDRGNIRTARMLCMNVFALNSVARFEDEVAKRLPCVGIFEWRGSDDTKQLRAQFDLNSVVSNGLSHLDSSVFFNPKLLLIAQDFISKNLSPLFISVHIRAEKLLNEGRNFSMVKTCLSNMRARVETIMRAGAVTIPVFMATDFARFGSSSKGVNPARENAKWLLEIFAPLKPIMFNPSEYKLADRGAVAIVEMNILASGKHLVKAGGGSFQFWIVNQFLHKTGNDRTKVERKLGC